MAKPQSNSIEGKISTFKDIQALLDYTSAKVQNEPLQVQAKALTYIAQKAPKYWDTNTIALTVILSRLEAQLENLSIAHNATLTQDYLDDNALKRIKLIGVSMAGIVTQTDTIAKRLSLTTSQLHGSSTRNTATNFNSREIADLAAVDLERNNSQTTKATTLTEAKAKAKQLLESLENE
jgi:phosphoribosylanthranilate isomerase